jgi:3-methylcrotonyl-CoA carboxylase alpha subunit
MFDKILIANRGEIACRIARTAKRLGISTVAVYSEADSRALHVELCDEAFCIGAAAANQSYLCGDKILKVARQSGAQAIHPGYGFLSENAAFATACEQAGIVFIGPPASAIEAMGSKSDAKRLMQAANVPLVPGYHGDDQEDKLLAAESKRIGFPQLIKASAGGGGKGMRIVNKVVEFKAALISARREALASFGDDRVLIERYLPAPRHVELQVFADKPGNVVHLFERDCSIQRRHQKIIEEAPAPGLDDSLRARMGEAAINCAKAIDYVGAGTVEFLLDSDGSFYFMEMNTRLQVEHPVTEMITGLDLVQWQLEVAAGLSLPLTQDEISLNGHAFEARIYAEAPEIEFLPCSGKLLYLRNPDTDSQVRVDTGVREGDEIGVFYDPMIAKLVVHGKDRRSALTKMLRALYDYQIIGLKTNIGFLSAVLSIDDFAQAAFDTGFIEKHRAQLLATDDLTPTQVILLTGLVQLLTMRQTDLVTRTQGEDINSPWLDAGSWRMNQVAKHLLRFSDETREYQIEVTEQGSTWQFELDQAAYQLSGRIAGGQRLLAEIDGEKFDVPLVVQGDAIYLWQFDRQWQFNKYSAVKAVLATDAGSADLVAPMPGNVIALPVGVGDEVRDGDTLVVIEAMKMEHSIVAPDNATVKEIFYQVGDQVVEGDQLIKLE